MSFRRIVFIIIVAIALHAETSSGFGCTSDRAAEIQDKQKQFDTIITNAMDLYLKEGLPLDLELSQKMNEIVRATFRLVESIRDKEAKKKIKIYLGPNVTLHWNQIDFSKLEFASSCDNDCIFNVVVGIAQVVDEVIKICEFELDDVSNKAIEELTFYLDKYSDKPAIAAALVHIFLNSPREDDSDVWLLCRKINDKRYSDQFDPDELSLIKKVSDPVCSEIDLTSEFLRPATQ